MVDVRPYLPDFNQRTAAPGHLGRGLSRSGLARRSSIYTWNSNLSEESLEFRTYRLPEEQFMSSDDEDLSFEPTFPSRKTRQMRPFRASTEYSPGFDSIESNDSYSEIIQVIESYETPTTTQNDSNDMIKATSDSCPVTQFLSQQVDQVLKRAPENAKVFSLKRALSMHTVSVELVAKDALKLPLNDIKGALKKEPSVSMASLTVRPKECKGIPRLPKTRHLLYEKPIGGRIAQGHLGLLLYDALAESCNMWRRIVWHRQVMQKSSEKVHLTLTLRAAV